jgi:S-formylglutathione hydrolase FrmB
MNVIIPQGGPSAKNRKYPVLYLLHGHSDDHTIWMRRTSIERYVEGMGLAVVMPAVNRSFYTDMKYGYKYWTFISEELPAIVRSLFPISDKREDNFAAGLSMGGYGAMKLVLNNPKKYAAAASLSGALDIAGHVEANGFTDIEIIFGENAKVRGTKNDLMYLVEKVAASNGPKPKLYSCCGTEDFLYQDNLKFRDLCRSLPLDYTYEEEPGSHEWGYWDMKIQSILKWLPLKKD